VAAVQRGDVTGLAMVFVHGDSSSIAVKLRKLMGQLLAEVEPGTFRQ
jgi:hypothetical protein